MKKKRIILVASLLVLLIFIFHYKIELKAMGLNNSKEWSNAIQLKIANITVGPDIIKSNDEVIIAYQDDKVLNLIRTDFEGNIKKDIEIVKLNQEPMNINLFENGKNIFVSYSISNENGKIVNILKFDEEFNIISNSKVENVKDFIKISENSYGLFFDNYIEVRDLKSGKHSTIKTDIKCSYQCVSKYKDSFILGYQKKDGKFQYAILKNGEIKYLSNEIQRTSDDFCQIVNPFILVKDESLYSMCRYVFKDGQMEDECLEIPIGKNIEINKIKKGEFLTVIKPKTGNIQNEYDINIDTMENIKLIQNIDNNMIISNANITDYKGKTQNQIIMSEFDSMVALGEDENYKTGLIIVKDVITNTRNISVYPASSDDYCAFVDSYNKRESRLNLISKDNEFIKKNSGYTNENRKDASITAIEKILTSIFFIMLTGLKWMLIPLAIVSIFSILEFKFSDRFKKILYVFSYIIMFVIRAIEIKGTFYNDIIGKDITKYISMKNGLLMLGIISIIIAIYSYRKYSKDIDSNIMALSIAPAIGIDIIVSLMIYIPLMY